MAGFLGMRGTGDWVTDQRPMSWRETLLMLYPNGTAPLTAITSKGKNEKITDPQYHWWTKTLPAQAGAVTGVYTDSGLSVAYVSGAVSGDYLFVKMAEATVGELRVGHMVRLGDASDYLNAVVAKVVERVANGASSYVKVKLYEDDDNGTSTDMSDCDRIYVVGNVNSEGAAMPDAISYDPVKWYNFTQIFRTSLEITRTARLTKLRTPQAYLEAKREALELHGIEMEKAFWMGIPSESVGLNGKPERTTGGIIPAITGGYTGMGGSAGTVSNFSTATAYSGQTWLQGGEHWLDTQLEVSFRYGRREKAAFCGSTALLALNRIVKNGGDYTFTPQTKSYGINVVEWVTPFGKINLIEHPLFSYETTMRDKVVVLEPENLKFNYITDTTFYDDPDKKNTGWTRRDGTKEEYLTECGLEYHHPISWLYLSGLGTDNAV